MPPRKSIKSTSINTQPSNGSITITKAEAKAFTIPKFNTQESLDDYFKEFLTDIHACLHFLTRYASSNSHIEKLIKVYNKTTDKFDKTFSLDKLAKDAKIDPGDFRRLMISTLDYLCTDDAEMSVRLSLGELTRKALARAMDDTYEDSLAYTTKFLESKGIWPTSKNQQLVNVNVSPVQNNSNIINQGLVVNGLPSFTQSAVNNEQLASKAVKQLIAETKHHVLDVESINIEKELVENG